jgi:hypothetical protein
MVSSHLHFLAQIFFIIKGSKNANLKFCVYHSLLTKGPDHKHTSLVSAVSNLQDILKILVFRRIPLRLVKCSELKSSGILANSKLKK